MPYKDTEKRKDFHRKYYQKYMETVGQKYRKTAEENRSHRMAQNKIDGALYYKLRRLQKVYGQVGVGVFFRDLCQCVSCGESDFRVLNLHHIIPKSKGGTNDVENLQVLCANCHYKHHFMDDLPHTRGGAAISQQSWDTHWMGFAVEVGKRSNCYSRKIGSVLVKDNGLISIGWNGPPYGIQDCSERNPGKEEVCPRKLVGANSGERLDMCIALHSEAAAVTNCAREGAHSTKGATLYCDCGIPCKNCLILIIASGIKRVVCNKDNTTGNYGDYYDITSKYLHKNSDVKIDFVDI